MTASRVYLGAVLAAFVAWVFLFVGPPGGQSLADKLTDSFVVEQTLARLKPEEGFRAKPYRDIEGVWTIGFGTNIGEGITRREGEYLLRERLAGTYEDLTKELPWLSAAPKGQQSAILDMGYQLGVHGVLEFRHMISALKAGECQAGKAAAIDSDWWRETPQRAERVTALLCED